jgi:hypothetical protein
VEIVASDAAAGEFGSDTARLTVLFPGGVNTAPLTVNYSVAGSATPGVDYAALSGSVTIPAGAIAASIMVLPLGGNLATNQVTVTVNLAVSKNYLLTGLTNATVVIQDRPINDWLRVNFTAMQLANSAISGDAADPANDGIPNLVKYALGLNPNAAEPNPFFPMFSNGIFTVTYSLSESAPDVALAYDWSTNLVTWTPGATVFQQISEIDQITNKIITIGGPPATTDGFFRFRATRQ